MEKQRVPRIKSERGRVVLLEPHVSSFDEDKESEFIEWAKSVQKPKAMDLFCGAGGLSLGLQDANFEVIIGIDHDREALQTHRANFPGLSVDWDLSNERVVHHAIQLGKAVGIDLISGGPPCQPFSKAGRSMIRDLVRTGRRNPNDQRRDLWQAFIGVVEGVRPSAVLMENVPDMALDRDMQILRTMVDFLERLDYSVSARVLDASRFEVPQFRQRLILVGLADNCSFKWPNESGYQVTLRTAIGDLPKVEGGWLRHDDTLGATHYEGPKSDFQRRAREGITQEHKAYVFDHITRPVRSDDQVIFSAMDSSTKYSEIDEAVIAVSRVSTDNKYETTGSLKRYRDDIFDDKYKRLDWDQLSRTITAHIAKDGYSYIHPEQDRTLTVRESARIQTFPDFFRFAGSPTSALKQIGNAVPPRLGEYLGTQILKSIAINSHSDTSTIRTAKLLSDWFKERELSSQLRYPWFSAISGLTIAMGRWQTIKGEMLLGRIAEDKATTVWPLLKHFQSPTDTLQNAEQIRDMSNWIGREDEAEKIFQAATWLEANLESLDSVAGMNSIPYVLNSMSVIAAHVYPGPEEDPVVASSGMLRVAARFTNTPVDRRNSGTDGRITVARMIGAEDRTSDKAFLALNVLAATVCLPSRPTCSSCPLRNTCKSAS